MSSTSKQTLTIMKDNVTISTSGTISVNYGDMSNQISKLNAITTAQNTGKSVSGTFTYTIDNIDITTLTSPFASGSYDIVIAFTPSDAKNYNNSTITISGGYIVSSLDVAINFSLKNPTITYGTMVTANMFDTTAIDSNGKTVTGTFSYTINGSPFVEQVFDAGTYDIEVLFTPTDTTNYKVKSNNNGKENTKFK